MMATLKEILKLDSISQVSDPNKSTIVVSGKLTAILLLTRNSVTLITYK